MVPSSLGGIFLDAGIQNGFFKGVKKGKNKNVSKKDNGVPQHKKMGERGKPKAKSNYPICTR